MLIALCAREFASLRRRANESLLLLPIKKVEPKKMFWNDSTFCRLLNRTSRSSSKKSHENNLSRCTIALLHHQNLVNISCNKNRFYSIGPKLPCKRHEAVFIPGNGICPKLEMTNFVKFCWRFFSRLQFDLICTQSFKIFWLKFGLKVTRKMWRHCDETVTQKLMQMWRRTNAKVNANSTQKWCVDVTKKL